MNYPLNGYAYIDEPVPSDMIHPQTSWEIEGLEMLAAVEADSESIDIANLLRDEDGNIPFNQMTEKVIKEATMEPTTVTKQMKFEEMLTSRCESLEVLMEEAIVSLNHSCTSCMDQFTKMELGNELDRCPTCGEQDTIVEIEDDNV